MTKKGKRIISAVAGVLSILVIGMLIFMNTGPVIPGGNELFGEIMTADLPELVTGQTGYAHNGKVKIWYEAFRPAGAPRGTVLLIMGHSATSLRWQNFHRRFVEAGYRVVRFDNRGVGLSDWAKDWNRSRPYTLEDMARDTLAVMDTLKIDRAHLVGISMGGMIAQQLAIRHGNRVASLTSIMSSGYMEDPALHILSWRFIKQLMRIVPRYGLMPSELDQVKFQTYLFFAADNNDANYDSRQSAFIARYEVEKHGGYNPRVVTQHNAAITASGSRYGLLGSIRVPTLVIHGKADPVVPFEHALKYAPMIPGAKTLFLDGMGHYIPRIHLGKIQQAILENTGR